MKKWAIAVIATLSLFLNLSQLVLPAQASKYNRCLQFDGTNYAEASRNLIPVNGDYTVEMMVYSTDKNLNRYAHYISQGAQPAPIYIGTDPNSKIRLGDTWINSQQTMPNNRWVHIALVHNANNSGQLYVDGSLVQSLGSQKYDTSKNGTFTRLGSQFWSGAGGEFFAGCLDNVRIWSSARTAVQIKDNMLLAEPKNRTGLVANYNFDNHYGFIDRIKTIESDTSDASLTLTFKNNPLTLPETGSLVSNSILTSCFNSKSTNFSKENLPQIDQIVARNKYITVAQMNLQNVPANSCVGVDVYIQGSNVPISTTVGINQIYSDLIYVDTALFECHVNSNNMYLLRPWRADGNSKSIYGKSVNVPGCAGEIPDVNGAALYGNETINLAGVTTPSIYPAVLERIKASGLQLPETSITGSNQKISDVSGCHAKVSVARLQRIENGKWLDAQPAEGWEQKSYCDSVHPYQPYVNANFADGTILRWYISDGNNWEVFSLPIVFKSNQTNSGTNQDSQSSPIPSADKSSTSKLLSIIAVPFAYSPIIKNNNVVINVSLNKLVSKDTRLYLTSSVLGYKSNNPLIGVINGSKGIFTIPKSKFENLKSDPEISMQTRSSTENSSPLKGKIPLNSLKIGAVKTAGTPQKVAKPIAAPTQTASATQAIKCYKGSLARTFLADSCPPGWITKS